MKPFFLILSCIALLGTIGCKNKGCNNSLSSKTAPTTEIQAVENYLNSYGITATKHTSGAYYKIVSQGTGDAPNYCAQIKVNYKGSLTDGSVFDQTSADPLSLTLSNTIYGWQALLPLIKNGGEITMYIPPSLGYGSTAQSGIPANSILIFEVSLKGVTNP